MEIIGKKTLKGVQVQIKDTINNKSRSFTVHNIDYDELFYKIYNYVKSIQKYAEVKLVCYKEKEGVKNEETIGTGNIVDR